MPISKKRDRLRKRRERAKARASPHRLSKRAVRELKHAGLDPEEARTDAQAFTLLRLDRDAIAAHLGWLQAFIARYGSVPAIERRLASQVALEKRVTQLEADLVVHEAQALPVEEGPQEPLPPEQLPEPDRAYTAQEYMRVMFRTLHPQARRRGDEPREVQRVGEEAGGWQA